MSSELYIDAHCISCAAKLIVQPFESRSGYTLMQLQLLVSVSRRPFISR